MRGGRGWETTSRGVVAHVGADGGAGDGDGLAELYASCELLAGLLVLGGRVAYVGSVAAAAERGQREGCAVAGVQRQV